MLQYQCGWSPVQAIDVVLIYTTLHLKVATGLVVVVIATGYGAIMNCAAEFMKVLASGLHYVNFTARWPAAIY